MQKIKFYNQNNEIVWLSNMTRIFWNSRAEFIVVCVCVRVRVCVRVCVCLRQVTKGERKGCGRKGPIREEWRENAVCPSFFLIACFQYPFVSSFVRDATCAMFISFSLFIFPSEKPKIFCWNPNGQGEYYITYSVKNCPTLVRYFNLNLAENRDRVCI